MKKLMRVKLINWHKFGNVTIEMGDYVLLSGENGAGKSTILDAIQFVMICSKNHFNKAAHEKGKRNLGSYLRCKTGREDRPYERTGALSGHIALEFYDEGKKQYFLVGAVLDSASEEKEPNVAWYLMEKQQLSDSLFLKGSEVKSISSFRSTNKGIKLFATTQTEARKIMKSRFGRLEDKFFSLIPKALAFKPIHDIKEFVYSYVLDEKEVNIDALKENVRSYQDLERMLKDVKVRIEELEVIRSKHGEVEHCLRRDRNQEYYLARADVEINEEASIAAEEKLRYEELWQAEAQKKKTELHSVYRKKQEIITALAVELQSDSDYQALHELELEETRLKEQLEVTKGETKLLFQSAKAAAENLEKLLQVRDVDGCVREYANLLGNLRNLQSLVELNLCLERVLKYKKTMFRKVQDKLADIRVELRGHQEQLAGLNHRIEQLEQKSLTFPAAVMELKLRIQEQFRLTGRTSEPRILCEMLEITNPAWQNAVEGYLNTQRFYLLVEPQDFDLAISVYDKMRENRKVYGVGLINTGKLAEYDQVPAGSLAEVVTSQNIWAKRYINMILGRVHMCQRYQELKQYPTAITRQCMRYQNHVVSAIPPEIYETPYIGAEAIARQLEMARNQRGKLEAAMKKLEEQQQNLGFVETALDTSADTDVKYRLPVLEREWKERERLRVCKESMKQLKQNETLIQKQIHLENLKEEADCVNADMLKTEKEIGRSEERGRQLRERLADLKAEQIEKKSILVELTEKLGADFAECEKEYEKQKEGKPLEQFRANFERARKANWTTKLKVEEEMQQAMNRYKTAHDFGAAATLAGFPEFNGEYDKLKNSRLLEYEDKVYQARQAAEEEFREQFLSKLQENIRQAQGEFKELNRALKDIPFSRERYEFLYEPSKLQQKYYQMIMDDFNVMQGESLFSGIFNSTHKEVIEELFEKLALDDENSSKTLELYTDYRTYMDYDIKITGDDGGFMLYSKVSQEKSGGETQTPFYITVAASFMQLYRNSIGGDAIGLVMLDEAFNNMDDERISGVLEFMTHSNLQMLIAAPPDKIQYIGPAVEKILLVLQDDKRSYVEEFSHETL